MWIYERYNNNNNNNTICIAPIKSEDTDTEALDRREQLLVTFHGRLYCSKVKYGQTAVETWFTGQRT